MANSSKLLIDEYPLTVLPSLAKAIGLNEAIVVQQLHYWLNNSKAGVERNGVKWVFNTYQEWQEQFPFWSERTIRRIFASLEASGLVVSDRLEAQDWSQRKYYTINYGKLAELPLDGQADQNDVDNLAGSSETSWPAQDGHSGRLIIGTTETSPETTTEKTDSLQATIEEANKTVDGLLEWEKRAQAGKKYSHRESLPETLIPYADCFVELTGQQPRKKELMDWIATFSEWQADGITPEHVKLAHAEAVRRDQVVVRPGSLDKLAAAAKGRQAKKSESAPNQETEYQKTLREKSWVPFSKLNGGDHA